MLTPSQLRKRSSSSGGRARCAWAAAQSRQRWGIVSPSAAGTRDAGHVCMQPASQPASSVMACCLSWRWSWCRGCRSQSGSATAVGSGVLFGECRGISQQPAQQACAMQTSAQTACQGTCLQALCMLQTAWTVHLCIPSGRPRSPPRTPTRTAAHLVRPTASLHPCAGHGLHHRQAALAGAQVADPD